MENNSLIGNPRQEPKLKKTERMFRESHLLNCQTETMQVFFPKTLLSMKNYLTTHLNSNISEEVNPSYGTPALNLARWPMPCSPSVKTGKSEVPPYSNGMPKTPEHSSNSFAQPKNLTLMTKPQLKLFIWTTSPFNSLPILWPSINIPTTINVVSPNKKDP